MESVAGEKFLAVRSCGDELIEYQVSGKPGDAVPGQPAEVPANLDEQVSEKIAPIRIMGDALQVLVNDRETEQPVLVDPGQDLEDGFHDVNGGDLSDSSPGFHRKRAFPS